MNKLIFTLIFIYSIVFINYNSFASLNNGLAAFYKFDGNANDLSGNKYHGTVTGASLIFDRNGNSNSAYNFSLDDNIIHCGNGFNLKLNNGGSIVAWIYPRSKGIHTDGWGRVIHKSGDEAYNVYMSNTNERINAWINNTQIYALNNSVPYNNWTHIVITFDQINNKIYINGELNTSISTIDLPDNVTSTFYIGNRGGEDRAFDGIIDDVLIYNRLLSDTEVNLLFHNTLPTISDDNSDCYTIVMSKIPDYTQNDSAYGGIPGNYCGPVSVSNTLIYLDNYVYGNLVANTTDRKKDQHDLIILLGSEDYFDSSDGSGPNSICRGLKKYIGERNYKYKKLEYQGWRSVNSEFYLSDIPELEWIKSGFNKNKATWLNIGWYSYDSGIYTRQGGHWVTLVGYCLDNAEKYLIIHDPASRAGDVQHNGYVQIEELSENDRLYADGEYISTDGYYLLNEGMYINPIGEYCILDGVVILEMEKINIAPILNLLLN